MSDRMTDERLAHLYKTGQGSVIASRELRRALVAERNEVERLEGRVVQLEAALTDLTREAQGTIDIDAQGTILALTQIPPRLANALDKAVAVLAEGATT